MRLRIFMNNRESIGMYMSLYAANFYLIYLTEKKIFPSGAPNAKRKKKRKRETKKNYSKRIIQDLLFISLIPYLFQYVTFTYRNFT